MIKHNSFTVKESMLMRKGRILCVVFLIALLAIDAMSQTAEFKKGIYSATSGDTKWAIKYDDGKLTLTRNGEAVVNGVYKITGNEIEVTDESGMMACGGDLKTGRYKWKLEGKNLTFEKIEDDCPGRAGALTSITWQQE